MNKAPNRFVAWLKRLEARADAWAGKRLTAQEYAEARAFDVKLKRNFWRWLGIYLVVSVAATAGVAMIAPKLGWGQAFAVANAICVGAMMVCFAAWFRYSKFVGARGRRTFSLLILGLFAGGLTGAIVGWVSSGRPLTDITPEKIFRILGVVSAIGIAAVALISIIVWLKGREVRHRLLLAEAEAERERHERQGTQAELKLLQAQVEPHFLFNTLANLRFLVQTDQVQAVAMLDHLIHYLRTALPEIRAESSTVGREMELAHSYLEIMRIRMGGALEISTTAPPELAALPFPPLVLLTLVENAIKHGIAPLGKGHVVVSAANSGGQLRLTVEDDGRGLVEPIGQGIGLANVRERLRAIFGERARFTLASGAGGGAVATIEVPL